MPRLDALRPLAMFAISEILAGCTVIATFDERPSDSDCPSVHGSKPLRVAEFCIDSTEATRGHYAEFLLDHGAVPTDSSAECAFNADLVPDPNLWGGGTGDPELPVRGVDVCDAREFCKWAGKRLCGRRQSGGGVVDDPNRNSAVASEWYYACSHAGQQEFPYGSTYEPASCTTLDSAVLGDPSPVGTMPNCEGGFAGLLDMSGNVWEWEDSCDGGSPAQCWARGGSYKHTDGGVSCEAFYLAVASDLSLAGDIGIRCCSD
jgi:formylglycine-generating enzyme required for sulfatase activity